MATYVIGGLIAAAFAMALRHIMKSGFGSQASDCADCAACPKCGR